MKACGKKDIVIRALIDPRDLSPEERHLLVNSPEYRAEGNSLRNDLDRLGKAACDLGPEPRGRLVLESSGKAYKAPFTRRFAPVFAFAAAALIVIAVFWRPEPWTRHAEPDIAAILEEMEDDHQLLNEIDQVVTYAQSGKYEEESDASGAVEGFLDDEFIDFLLPLEDDQSVKSIHDRPFLIA